MHTDTAIDVRRRPERSRASLTLDSFARASEHSSGIRLRDLSACDLVHIRTRNSLYRLWVLNPFEARVLVQGGAFFCFPVEATIAGATAGGCMLKVGWILDGFNLEILHDGQRIVTTAVGSIDVNPPDALPGPF